VITDVKEGSLGKYGDVISEIQARSTQFIYCNFAYEGRAHNYEAHNLARHGLTLETGRHLWLVTPYTPYTVNIPVNILINE
jgi:hypothetical protein